ncbi:MAG: hypothetical protein J2P31_03360, partial [Blastocatellia bacterium]|nr:hypothetical protein [Blastocatellia bacterium]
AQRAREHAKELARIEARNEDILPGSPELPNLDPLGGGGTATPETTAPVNKPLPTPTVRVEQEQKPVRQAIDAKPAKPIEATVPTPERKGKKGKVEDP